MQSFTEAIHLMVIILVVDMTFHDCQRHFAKAYPTYMQRKPDPFVALANTLRQQEQEEQQQQQQFHRSPFVDNSGYYYDYGREGPSEEDLLRMEQFQRMLSRAAMMPFFGRTQRSWGNVIPDTEYSLFYDRDDPVSEIEDIGEDPLPGSEWHDAAVGMDQGYDSTLQQFEDSQQDSNTPTDNQMLLDTLSEYMMLYGGMGSPNDRVTEEEEVKRSDNHELYDHPLDINSVLQANQKDSKKAVKSEMISSLPTQAPTVATPSTSASVQLQSFGHKEPQPPVQRSKDGTPLGQKEFPMMRPATPPRNNWFANHISIGSGTSRTSNSKSSVDNNTKRHAKNFSQMTIVMPEDELTEELDNLKTKKN